MFNFDKSSAGLQPQGLTLSNRTLCFTTSERQTVTIVSRTPVWWVVTVNRVYRRAAGIWYECVNYYASHTAVQQNNNTGFFLTKMLGTWCGLAETRFSILGTWIGSIKHLKKTCNDGLYISPDGNRKLETGPFVGYTTHADGTKAFVVTQRLSQQQGLVHDAVESAGADEYQTCSLARKGFAWE